MTTEQRRALANSIPSTEVIRDAVTFPRDRLGEPLDISGERFDAWLAQVRRDAAREALDGLAEHIDQIASHFVGFSVGSQKAQDVRDYRDAHYPEETP
ncbi:hypothetical protein ACTXM8_10165 [Brachybacterium alimentarium]|uniref:hypothetical protein n=1 Tax=Brachybacterium alimentarium TaxID=47845 RepID=UPI003FD1EA14